MFMYKDYPSWEEMFVQLLVKNNNLKGVFFINTPLIENMELNELHKNLHKLFYELDYNYHGCCLHDRSYYIQFEKF